MDSLRVILYISLILVGFNIYQAWQVDYPMKEVGSANKTEVVYDVDDIPSHTAVKTQQTKSIEEENTKTIRVTTDVLDILIDTKGGNIVQSELLDYPIELGSDKNVLLQNRSKQDFFAVQSGLVQINSDSGTVNANSVAPNHYAQYQAEKSEYVLTENSDDLIVELHWQQRGISVTKIFQLKRGSYLIDVSLKVVNNSSETWSGYQYNQLQRVDSDTDSPPFIITYTGGVIYSPQDKYEKIKYEDMEKNELKRSFNHGWLAMIQHYFMTAWIPLKEETRQYFSKTVQVGDDTRYILGAVSPSKAIEQDQSAEFSTQLYIGPKIQDDLEKIADGLELTVDYGVLTILSKPLFFLLQKIHDFVGNWGWAIIILTIFVKLLFYPLSESSYRAMAKIRKLTPEMQRIRERYSDDRRRQSQALMELYKKEKANPLGGCLPMLIQIPVFIALYWALLESVELRQAPFILWIQDLSIRDPYFILPVFMGLTMFIQQKLGPTPADPNQAKVMMIMPVVFTGFFMMFPSGLVLYWVTSNILSILQQWIINKRMEKGLIK